MRSLREWAGLSRDATGVVWQARLTKSDTLKGLGVFHVARSFTSVNIQLLSSVKVRRA